MLLFSFWQQLTQPRPNSQDDLLHLFKTFGQPSKKLTWIFNGDLVDRGDHACEIVLLIFALKLKHPKFVFVNRGNHEEPHINIYSGFEEECMAKYDHRVFQMFHAAFVWLPYACIVNGKTLVLHGGLPRDETVSVNDIRNIARFFEKAYFSHHVLMLSEMSHATTECVSAPELMNVTPV